MKDARGAVQDIFSRALRLHQEGRLEEAEALYRRVLAVEAKHADSLHLLGVIASQSGRPDEAVKQIRKAIALNPGAAHYHYNLAKAHRDRGRWKEAAASYRRVVELKPDHGEAFNNLGGVLQRLGRPDEALACYSRAAALRPAAAEIHANLGNSLRELGRSGEAAACYRRAVELGSRDGEVHGNLGMLLQELPRPAEAAECFRRALAIGPDNAAHRVNLGNALREMGHTGEAAACYRRASELSPDDAKILNNLGVALQELDRLDEALSCFGRALALRPDFAEVHGNLANALRDLGRLDEAAAVYQKAVAVNPRAASVWCAWAEQKKFCAGDPEIALMEELLGPDGLKPDNDRMLVHFALGKAYLDLGESESAFFHLGEANRLKRKTIAYDAANMGTLVAGLAGTFTPALFKRFAGAGAVSALPVFVLGIPRSGTTLVEQILSSHPQVHGAGELSILPRLIEPLGGYPGFMDAMTAGDLTRLGAAYLADVSPRAEGRRHVVDKLPGNVLYAGLIRLLLPDAHIIHCRRDPVDTCLSCYTKLFGHQGPLFAYDLAELGRYHRDYQALTAHWRTVLPPSHFLEVDYEAVVENVETEARRLLDFLGLPWDESCLRFHENRRPVRTVSASQVRRPIYTTSVGRWKRHARHLGPLLDALGIEENPVNA